ncbi:5' nucleotidase, NT5C type [Nocardioides jensenii]|uniref:5' nucleotidase, NT5C type n=1 Tax=Nocardioides jensenii TaxID=1843 RepID=UPI000A77591C|nr:hypothetical protein [Nocardioides jensenii]
MATNSNRQNGWRVGFDLDGVVYDFRRAISDYLVNAGRTECSLDRAHPHWDFFKGWGLTLEEYLDLYKAGVDAGQVLRHGDPLPGSVEATETLARAGHSIHIVTDRSVGSQPGISSRHTAAWLADHNFVFHSLTFSSDKTAVDTDFFIDDRFENYVARVAKGLNCHLLTRPWNQDLGDKDTQRVDSVEEFVDIVLRGSTASTRSLAMTHSR